MKLYVISQNVNDGYDTYDSAVVAATSEEEAKTYHPGDVLAERWDPESERWFWLNSAGQKCFNPHSYGPWAKHIDEVQVQYIGEAAEGVQAGPIVSSFNAG